MKLLTSWNDDCLNFEFGVVEPQNCVPEDEFVLELLQLWIGAVALLEVVERADDLGEDAFLGLVSPGHHVSGDYFVVVVSVDESDDAFDLEGLEPGSVDAIGVTEASVDVEVFAHPGRQNGLVLLIDE